MFKAAASIAVIASLAVALPALAAQPQERPMGWFAQSIRSVVVFNSCTQRLKEKFNIGPLNGIEVTDMDTAGAAPSGAMDVKFAATPSRRNPAARATSSASAMSAAKARPGSTLAWSTRAAAAKCVACRPARSRARSGSSHLVKCDG